ncbi:hypothetical protein G3T14_11645 [Methylobacterium sp. BTF04]|uniref:hypothetical protein n=1 Tax=Methylobacterium sp. BTF04 TaxID=2708300 RepID=UPI0013CF773D|nr:hypothetical protein [Methylobacterium sp. BTF04]NEU12785.1 hypothetical protein [Methylobacterium sp. BTF04]
MNVPKKKSSEHATAAPPLSLYMRLRRKRLLRALCDYPVYDPPHRREERLLSLEQAAENFEYFMSVRQQRLAFFQSWLQQHFRVKIEPSERGVRRLNRWANFYAGFLLYHSDDPSAARAAYFCYQQHWTADFIGCNVVFDMGIALGEFITIKYPHLHWDFDPVYVSIRRARDLPGGESRLSFQRPLITGFKNGDMKEYVLEESYLICDYRIKYGLTICGGLELDSRPDKHLIWNWLLLSFKRAAKDEATAAPKTSFFEAQDDGSLPPRPRSSEFSALLPPGMWLRRRRLLRALRDYPVYDPPHKKEERLLSREQAVENFDYFMRIRHQRLAFFQAWLQQNFRVTINSTERGVRKINRWGNDYAGLLLYHPEDLNAPGNAYFFYKHAWIEDFAGCNVVFDMGIALGEFIIANCPNLYWTFDPLSEKFPKSSRLLKNLPGMSFWRAEISGYDSLTCTASPLHDIYTYAQEIYIYTNSLAGKSKFQDLILKKSATNRIIYLFIQAIESYPSGYPPGFKKDKSEKEYIDMFDELADEESDEDD